MPQRKPSRLFAMIVTFVAPGLLILGGLMIAGALKPLPALVGAAVLSLLGSVIAWRHASGLDRMRQRIDGLAASGEDTNLDAPTLPELSLAVGRLARAWHEIQEKSEAKSAAADRILEALPDPLIVVDNRRQVVRANHAATDSFQTALTGRDLATGVRHPLLLRAVDSALADGISLAEEISLPAPMERSYSALVEPLGEGGEAGAVIVLHDLTPIRMGERMRADFVANVSHELRTPLSSLLGFVETLRGPAHDDADARDSFLGIMHEQAERMTRLIEDLLSLSRIEMDEHLRPQSSVDLRQIIANVETMLTMKARDHGMTIEVDAPGDLAPVPGDPDQITQVLQNLVDNAIKYGRTKTPVEIKVNRPEPDAVAITVVDHGEGIPREHLPRLTERFYRVDAARSRALGGTGLGLAIVKHIVNRHRGTLSIDSTDGEGSRFTVTLPAVAPPDVAGDAETSSAA